MSHQPQPLRLGIIGLDTSHAIAFTELLNDPQHPYHVKGGQVVVAYPGGSADFELSYSRVEGFTDIVRDKFHVRIVDSPEAAAEQCEAILLESADGRVHLEQFRQIAPYGKPVFVDKPITIDADEAQQLFAIADQYSIPVMSCSSLRFAEGLVEALADSKKGPIIGMDCYGSMTLQPTQPGLFWYGIHCVEMLIAVLGPGCLQVHAASTEEHDVITGVWEDGRIGTIRGNRSGNHQFGAILHRQQGSRYVDMEAYKKPYYASLLEKVIAMFTTGVSPIQPEETMHIIRFIEAANQSRESGKMIQLRS